MDRLGIDLSKHLDKTALIHHKKDKPRDEIKYKDLMTQIHSIGLILESEKLSNKESVAIGILCKKNPSAISLLLSILESNFAFCFLSRNEIHADLNKLGVKYFFSDEAISSSKFHELRNSLEVFGKTIFLYKVACQKEVRIFKDNGDRMNEICYTITTSGSTGQRKIVRVTYNSIASNIISLQKIFGLDTDVIYSSAPCSFDVFVLDLFLSLCSGSALMIVDENLRYSDESLQFMFQQATGVSFLQITPSLFQQYGIETIREKILSHDSSLKFLVLGGEQFPPTKEVSTWQDWESPTRKRVFNIYGTTEVSCWSMIHEVTKNDFESGEVPLGKLLDDTWMAFSPDLTSNSGLEEIVLTSHKRVCYIDETDWDEKLTEGHQFAHHTGDLVRRDKEKIFYHGRKNSIIKQFGQKVDLNQIEIVASEIVPSVSCIFIKKKIVLFVKTDDDMLIKGLKHFLKKKLKPNEVPDDIRKISFFPLSENGKISKEQLTEIYKDFLREDRERRIEAEESFIEAINQILNLQLGKVPSSSSSDEPDGKRVKTNLDLTFKELGGTSFDALRISMKLEDQTGLSNGLLSKLLGDKYTIRDIVSYLQEVKPNDDQQFLTIPRKVSSSIVTEVVKRFNLDKCIDATPSLIHLENEAFISVGSHSHQLVTINANSLKLKSKTIFNDRIESEVTSLKSSGLAGCYDGNLYCFDLQCGEILWKFDSKGMIKSKAVVVGGLIIFGNYNYEKNLWCLQQSESGGVTMKWNQLVGTRGILAMPLVINESSVLICTLDGTCEVLNVVNGEKIWNKKFESPIFSTPRKIPKRDEIVLAEVSRSVHCIDFEGNVLWSFQAGGHIFSSFLFHQPTDDEVKIIFGCHDKKLRCLNYNFEKQSANVVWSSELNSQIYGTPQLVTINSNDFAVSCTTSGHINFVNLAKGTVNHTHKLPGEIFSTPVIFDRMMFVGCRDNFLYCIKF